MDSVRRRVVIIVGCVGLTYGAMLVGALVGALVGVLVGGLVTDWWLDAILWLLVVVGIGACAYATLLWILRDDDERD